MPGIGTRGLGDEQRVVSALVGPQAEEEIRASSEWA